MGEQEYIFDLGGCSVDEVCAVIQSYVDTNEGEVSCNFGTPNSHYARIEFSLSSAWHGFTSFDQLTSHNEQEQYSTMTLLTLHGKTTLRITPVVGDWLVFKPHVDKIIAHMLPNGQTVERQPVGAQTKEQPDPEINEPDQWLIKQFFDIHQGKRGLPYFRDEWLRRREENDMNPLVNVGDSMRQVTKKERERRRMKKHE